MPTLENILGKGNPTGVQGTAAPATPTGNQAPAVPQPPTPEGTSRVPQTATPQATDTEEPQEVAPQTTPPEQRKTNQGNHGKVLREFGDGIHAYMEDGTIRTSGFAGYTYSNPAEVRMSYEEMFKQLNPYKPPTQEELEKERKKQRRERVFAAIGDGISALSNLYFTTQYAPNMYTGKDTASQRTKERWDKLASERNANMKAYIDGLMKARQADDEYNDSEREWKRKLGLDKIKQDRDKAADARAEAEEQRKEELHPFAKRKAESDAQTAETQAKYAEEYEKSRIGRNNAAAGASNASASASRARARHYGSGGSGGSKDMQEAYDYWMSLTDEQKKQYRDWNNRYRKIKTGTDDDDNPIYSNQYMDDDDDFIKMVWKQRQGWLKNNNPDGKKQINGFGGGNSGKKKIAGFGG